MIYRALPSFILLFSAVTFAQGGFVGMSPREGQQRARTMPYQEHGFPKETVEAAQIALSTHCESGDCSDRQAAFEANGDETASYLIAQWEAGVASEEYFPHYFLLRYLGDTQSKVALEYLLGLLAFPGHLVPLREKSGQTFPRLIVFERDCYQMALEGLGRHRDPEALRALVRGLGSDPGEPFFTSRINAIGRYIENTGTTTPGLRDKLLEAHDKSASDRAELMEPIVERRIRHFIALADNTAAFSRTVPMESARFSGGETFAFRPTVSQEIVIPKRRTVTDSPK